MNTTSHTDATQILFEWSEGSEDAPSRLMPLVYQELLRRAAVYLRGERPDHTLQATALVHEAYLELVDQKRANWKSRAHFCTVAAQLMRRILLEHARAHNTAKRGGRLQKVYLDETRELAQDQASDLVELDEALQSLAAGFPRESQVVEMKFFGGMEAREIAEILRVSEKTVLRDWNFSKIWLCRELARQNAHA
ncbi:MAG: ECF-type sigma factor [Verrucomicrobiota bacterium]|nr:ECF-type sigma factor [Verrucomicrobiota bacterium]